jgi:hypothetical protein
VGIIMALMRGDMETHFINFNQDCTSLAIGTKYVALHPCHPDFLTCYKRSMFLTQKDCPPERTSLLFKHDFLETHFINFNQDCTSLAIGTK